MLNRFSPLNLLIVSLLSAPCGLGWSQVVDPFGEVESAGPVAPDPSGPGAPQQEHPVVMAIRDQNPTTPVQLMKAVVMLIDIDQPDEAKSYLQKLIAARPNLDQKAELQQEFGTATFMRLARYEPLLPEGRYFALDVVESAYARARDPKRLVELVRQLSDPSLGVSRKALSELRLAGEAALPPMIHALADPARSGEHANLREALINLGDISVEPLIGMLGAPDEDTRLQAIHLLGKLESRRALLHLIGPYVSEETSPRARAAAEQAIQQIVGTVPNKSEAERYLFRHAQEFYEGKPPRQVKSDGSIELWRWNSAAKTSLPVRYAAAEASLIEAARTADQLSRLFPDRVEHRRLFLSSILQSDKLYYGLQRPLVRGEGTAHAVASSTGLDAVLDTLEFAVKTDHIPAAIGAVEVLGDIGGASLLHSNPGRPGPVARLLRHRDRRLQFAAAKTILQWDPQRPYPGASHLVDVFQYFAGTDATRVVIGHTRIEQARDLIATFVEAGIRGEVASNGRDVFRRAVSSPDVEFVVISDSVDFPEMNELLQMLRKDPRAANLPIGLLAREENIRRSRRIAELDDMTLAFPWPGSDAESATIRSRLRELAGVRFIDDDERARQARESLQALIALAAAPDRYSFYDVLRVEDAAIAALHRAELASSATKLLGLLATQKAQLALVDFASQAVRDLEQRQLAADGFRAAVQRRRVLLTTLEIQRQYDRYNASAKLDKPTQQVLASILDTIEQRGTGKPANSNTGAGEPVDSTS